MKLLIVEDEPSIRESLVDYFVGQEFVVDAVESSERANQVLDGHDAILLDLALPGQDGIDWLASIRSRGNSTPVLIMTARGGEEQRIAGLQAGADDYVVKPFSVRELEARVRAVLRRTNPRAERVVQIGAAVVDLPGHEVRLAGQTHLLKQKEADLLAYLVEHEGETLDRAQLLTAVWGYENCPTTRAVDTHMLNLRKKVEIDPQDPQHLLTVHRVGYRLVR